MRIYLHGITVFILKQGPDSVLMFQTPVLVAGQPASMDKPEEKGLAEEKEAEIDIKEQFDLDQMPMQLQLLHSFLMVSTHAWHGSASSSIWFSTSLWGWVRCWDRWMCVQWDLSILAEFTEVSCWEPSRQLSLFIQVMAWCDQVKKCLFSAFYRPWTRRLMPTPSTSSSNQPSCCVCTQNVSVWRDRRMTDLSSFASNTSWFPSEWHQQGIGGISRMHMYQL